MLRYSVDPVQLFRFNILLPPDTVLPFSTSFVVIEPSCFSLVYLVEQLLFL